MLCATLKLCHEEGHHQMSPLNLHLYNYNPK